MAGNVAVVQTMSMTRQDLPSPFVTELVCWHDEDWIVSRLDVQEEEKDCQEERELIAGETLKDSHEDV